MLSCNAAFRRERVAAKRRGNAMKFQAARDAAPRFAATLMHVRTAMPSNPERMEFRPRRMAVKPSERTPLTP
jgi:hypothetical protein